MLFGKWAFRSQLLKTIVSRKVCSDVSSGFRMRVNPRADSEAEQDPTQLSWVARTVHTIRVSVTWILVVRQTINVGRTQI